MSAKSNTSMVAMLTGLACAAFLASTSMAKAGEFGVSVFDQQITSDVSGDSFVQAGGHPYSIVTEIEVKHHAGAEIFEEPLPEETIKDVIVSVPPGLIGNPAGLGQCTEAQLIGTEPSLFKHPECPIDSVVGTIHLITDLGFFGGSMTFPVFNMVPPANEPASFGFSVVGEPITFYGNVRNGGDFGVNVTSLNIPDTFAVSGLKLTFWGIPADSSHDDQRCNQAWLGYESSENKFCPGEPGTPTGPNADPVQPKAFLTLPTSCTDPGIGFKSTVRIDSWPKPGIFSEMDLFNHVTPGYPLPSSEWGGQQSLTGCDLTPFNPKVSVEPTNANADTPAGLDVDISLPQDGLLNPQGIGTSDLKKAVVALPEGVSVSPSAADGLGACSLAQIGLSNGAPAGCPDSSKLGTVEIDTPLLNEPLKGSVYLGKQAENPFGSLIALYIVVEGHGVILKLPGRVDLDPVTGRIVTTFDNNPQLPFDHLKLNFKAGPRSPLVNPHACGSYETTAEFTPWSGNPPVTVNSSFEITSGPGGGPCPSPGQAFAPRFAAGTTNNQAGAFSPFSLTFTRADGEQQLGGVSLKMPLGLLGTLSTVSLCPEPQASRGSCPAGSEMGSVTAGAGAGANPFYVTGGKVFLTSGYKGAPFGLSIVVPAVAGPFNLGTVVVRASIAVDPQTAQLTVSSDPLPTILDGIPLDLRTVNVSVDKPGFIFNPTNCDPMSLTGTLTGGSGGIEPVSNSFQVTNCGVLGFKPGFKVSTPGRTSRANGAGLDVKLSYPAGSMGKQANIAKVKVDLPKQLPSRLTTLQKACPDSVFNQNPAACGEGSKVGQATAVTPVLPEALHGPAYFVSHGGAKFPELVVVLSGYGVTVDLHGETFISPAGITSSTFRTVPDVPISTFELKLPQGPNSALAANGNLCASKLKMPTAFTAQDGAVIRQSTPITATGCAKHKARKAKKRKR
jgi:hypothetical protein